MSANQSDQGIKVVAGLTMPPMHTPEYLQQRHDFPAALRANIAGLEKLVQAAIAI